LTVRSDINLVRNDLQNEQAVLGSMLLDRGAVSCAVQVLGPEDFYLDRHRVIYSAMLDLAEHDEPVDLVTVTNRLAVMGKLEDGGATYLASLPNVVPTATNAATYVNIVLEQSVLRALINTLTSQNGDAPEAVIANTRNVLDRLTSRSAPS